MEDTVKTVSSTTNNKTNSDEDKKPENRPDYLHESNILIFSKWVVVFSLVAIIITIILYLNSGYINLTCKVNPSVIGTFGDFIGGFIGTLLSLVTVFLVWLAYISQKKELKELAEQGQKQVRIQQQQVALNLEMQAEATFFNLLNSIRSLVANTKGNVKDASKMTYDNQINNFFSGNEYYNKANKELQDRMMKALGDAMLRSIASTTVKDEKTIKAHHDLAKETYNKFFEEHLPELSHYFRFTFNVLNFVATHTYISAENKVRYINFVQSQMSDAELQLIYFNGVGKHGQKFYKLIEDYNFLQNMSYNDTIEFLDEFYPNSTFRL